MWTLCQGPTILDQIAGAYGACLAALPGLYWLRNHPAACLAGDRERGQLLLLSQEEITSRLREREVPARFGGEGGL